MREKKVQSPETFSQVPPKNEGLKLILLLIILEQGKRNEKKSSVCAKRGAREKLFSDAEGRYKS